MAGVQEFLQMGGYGIYVWSAYGLTFIVLGLNVLVPLLREKRIVRTISRQTREIP